MMHRSKAVTAKQVENFGCGFNGSRKYWEKEIRKLMQDFCIPRKTIEQIICDTKLLQTSSDTNDSMYQKAWAKFKGLLEAN